MIKKYFIYGKVFHRHLRILVKLISDLVGVKGYVTNDEDEYVSLVLVGSLAQLNFILNSIKSQFRQGEILIKESQEKLGNELGYTKFDIV